MEFCLRNCFATYAEVADTEKAAKAILTMTLITLSNKMLEESKKQIEKEDGKTFYHHSGRR